LQILYYAFCFWNHLGGKQALNRKKISIAIPASVVSDTPHLREKTSKVGLIGRAAAMFRVDEIILFPDNPKISQIDDMKLISNLLSYMETPQYLRKRLFELTPDLRYAGILPPLRTTHHPLERQAKNLKAGQYREGVTVSRNNEDTLVDIGVEQHALIRTTQLPLGTRVTVKIVEVNKIVETKLVSRNEISDYWGYSIVVEKKTFGKMTKCRAFDLTIATSRYGRPFADIANDISGKWRAAKTVLVAFGPPTRGLHEICRQEGLRLEDVTHFVVNMIPAQGTETVRTEEALLASLGVLNTWFYKA
jgi:predicted SPOUT superfamily RNA methylase MTH1